MDETEGDPVGEAHDPQDGRRVDDVLAVPQEEPGDVGQEVDGVGDEEGRGEHGGAQVHGAHGVAAAQQDQGCKGGGLAIYCLFIYHFSLFIFNSLSLFFYPSIHIFIYPSIHPSFHRYIYLYAYLPIDISNFRCIDASLLVYLYLSICV